MPSPKGEYAPHVALGAISELRVMTKTRGHF